MRVKNFGEVNEPGEVGDGVVSVVGDEVVPSEPDDDFEYEAETLPLSPEAGQRVENLERQSADPHSLEDSAL